MYSSEAREGISPFFSLSPPSLTHTYTRGRGNHGNGAREIENESVRETKNRVTLSGMGVRVVRCSLRDGCSIDFMRWCAHTHTHTHTPMRPSQSPL